MAKKALKKAITKRKQETSATLPGTAQGGLIAMMDAQLKVLRDQEHAIGVQIAQLQQAKAILTPKTVSTAKPATLAAQPAGQQRKPRDYEMFKEKVLKPMTMVELEKATGKKSGTLQQTMQSYPGLLKSDGKRPATYTLDTAR